MKLTKKLFIAIMTMALLVVTFSASTFAWFTLGQESEISNFNVKVKTSAGMEISLDGKTWKNNIALADNAIDFVDLTSTNGKNIYKMNKNDNNEAVAALSNLAAGANETPEYFEQVIYVRITKNKVATGDFDKIYLDSVSGQDKVFTGTNASPKWLSDARLAHDETSGETTTSVLNKYTDAEKTIEEGVEYEFDALNAVKISFTANADTEANVIYAYENSTSWGTASNTGLAKDYADAKDFSLTKAVALGTVAYTTYGINTTDTANVADGTKLVKYDVSASEKGIVLTSADDFGNFASLGFATDYVTNPNDTDYVYAKLTIRVWLEGWDADCINAILEQETVFSLVLKAHEAE